MFQFLSNRPQRALVPTTMGTAGFIARYNTGRGESSSDTAGTTLVNPLRKERTYPFWQEQWIERRLVPIEHVH
jgi:hypothetical protein